MLSPVANLCILLVSEGITLAIRCTLSNKRSVFFCRTCVAYCSSSCALCAFVFPRFYKKVRRRFLALFNEPCWEVGRINFKITAKRLLPVTVCRMSLIEALHLYVIYLTCWNVKKAWTLFTFVFIRKVFMQETRSASFHIYVALQLTLHAAVWFIYFV